MIFAIERHARKRALSNTEHVIQFHEIYYNEDGSHKR